jgi:hypothetical protein
LSLAGLSSLVYCFLGRLGAYPSLEQSLDFSRKAYQGQTLKLIGVSNIDHKGQSLPK